MKKSTTLFDALEHLLTKEDLTDIAARHGYQEIGRKMTFSVLLRVLILAAVHEWKSFRHAADVAEAYGVPAFHFSALSKKAGQVPYGMMKEVFSLAL